MASAPSVGAWSVMRDPAAGGLLVASMLARLPMGAIGLLLVLQVKALTGSFAAGGAVAGAQTVALAVSAPVVGRLTDRFGPARVLPVSAVVCAAALAAISALPDGTPVPAIGALAVVSGLAQPLVGPALRALWPRLLDDDRLHAVYALESAVLEITYILGPLVLVGVIAAASPAAAIATCAGLYLAGTLLFVLRPLVRRAPAVDGVRGRGLLGPLRAPGVRVLAGTLALCGATFGAVELAVAARADELDARAAIGLTLGVWGAGSLVGGLIAGRRRAPGDPARYLAALLAALALLTAALALAWSPEALIALAFLAGLPIAPTLAAMHGLLGRLAPAGSGTEAFTWTATGMSGGLALGTALTGVLVDAVPPAWGFVAAACTMGAGALLIVARAAQLSDGSAGIRASSA